MIIQDKYIEPPFKITIKKDSFNRQYYFTEVIFDTSKYNSLTKSIENQILSEKGFLDLEIVKLQPLIDYLKISIEEKLDNIYSSKIPRSQLNSIRDWMIYKIIGFERIIPLLLDDNVQEIYMDKPNTQIYIDHQRFGRCRTNIILADDEIEHLKTRLCLEKDVLINILNPSIKVEMKTDKFHIRAAIDIPPLASDGISMNIRKLRRKIWTLPELVSVGMLSIEASAYILFLLKRRCNFTVIGEPGSGKTTLANAFDLLTPNKWRKISIEDVIESVEQTTFGKFQTRYSVAPFESNNVNSSKSSEIIKLLHRSPTWVFLGEIQTAEHSKALFEALSAGLVGIQTCHGRSVEMMILRWINQHNIPLSSILTLDILIENNYSFEDWGIKRNVFRIVEISKEPLFSMEIPDSLKDIKLIEIFKMDIENNQLKKCINLFESPSLNIIKKKEKITENAFYNELNYYKESITHLISKKIYDPKHVIEFLNFDRKTLNSKAIQVNPTKEIS